MVRWPFLGPGAEGLREEEEEGGRLLVVPWAIVGRAGRGGEVGGMVAMGLVGVSLCVEDF